MHESDIDESETCGHEIVEPHPQPSSAKEFLELLSPTSDFMSALSDADEPLVYRGVKFERDHRLLPSAFRPNSLIHRVSHGNSRYETPEWRASEMGSIYREAKVLLDFVERCNEIGLPIPVDLDIVRTRIEEILNTVYFAMRAYVRRKRPATAFAIDWPPPEVRSCLSLAQHYGVPTRLLDFTDSASHAAFFASELEDEDLGGDVAVRNRGFAVYCIVPSRVRYLESADAWDEGVDDLSRYRFYRPLRFGNANVAAQSGSFIYRFAQYRISNCRDIKEYGTPAALSELEKVIYQWERPFGARVVCPFEAAPEVRRLLRRQGIARRHVYPSYSAAADDLRRELLARPLTPPGERS